MEATPTMPNPSQMVRAQTQPQGNPTQTTMSEDERLRLLMEGAHPENRRQNADGTYQNGAGRPMIPVPGGQMQTGQVTGAPVAQQPMQAQPAVVLEPLDGDGVDSVIDLAETLFVDGVNENMSAPATRAFAEDCLRRAHIFRDAAVSHVTRYTPPADEEPALEEESEAIDLDLTEESDGDSVGRRGRGRRKASGDAEGA